MEKQFAELRAEVLGLQPRTKDWRRTVGMMPDDETSRNAARLGREWRDQANEVSLERKCDDHGRRRAVDVAGCAMSWQSDDPLITPEARM